MRGAGTLRDPAFYSKVFYYLATCLQPCSSLDLSHMEGQIFGCHEDTVSTSHPSTQHSEDLVPSSSSKRFGTQSGRPITTARSSLKRKSTALHPSGLKLERQPRFIGQLGSLQCHDTTNDDALEDIDEGSDADAADASIPAEYRDIADPPSDDDDFPTDVDPIALLELGSDLLDAIQDAIAALSSLTARIDASASAGLATAATSSAGLPPGQ